MYRRRSLVESISDYLVNMLATYKLNIEFIFDNVMFKCRL